MHFLCHELMVASETPDSPSVLTGTTGPYTRCQTQDQQGGLEVSDPGGCPRGGVSQMASSIAPGTRRHPRLCSPLLSWRWQSSCFQQQVGPGPFQPTLLWFRSQNVRPNENACSEQPGKREMQGCVFSAMPLPKKQTRTLVRPGWFQNF